MTGTNMAARFSIAVDVPRDLVRITMAGFFDAEAITRFVAARNEAHRALRSAPNEHLTLVDIRDMGIQAQDSVAGFQAVLSDPGTASRRIAFVVPPSLARMQIRRAADHRQAGYFRQIDEAEHWLLEAP